MYPGDPNTPPSSSYSSGSSVGYPSPTAHHPSMIETHMGSPVYDVKAGGEMMAPGPMYDPRAREIVFHDRGYDRAY